MRSEDGVIAPDGVVVLGMAAAMFTMVTVRFCGGEAAADFWRKNMSLLTTLRKFH